MTMSKQVWWINFVTLRENKWGKIDNILVFLEELWIKLKNDITAYDSKKSQIFFNLKGEIV